MHSLAAAAANGVMEPSRVSRARPFEREGENAKEDRFRSGKRESEQESERQGASRKNNLAETNAQTPVLGGWLQAEKRGP